MVLCCGKGADASTPREKAGEISIEQKEPSNETEQNTLRTWGELKALDGGQDPRFQDAVALSTQATAPLQKPLSAKAAVSARRGRMLRLCAQAPTHTHTHTHNTHTHTHIHTHTHSHTHTRKHTHTHTYTYTHAHVHNGRAHTHIHTHTHTHTHEHTHTCSRA